MIPAGSMVERLNRGIRRYVGRYSIYSHREMELDGGCAARHEPRYAFWKS